MPSPDTVPALYALLFFLAALLYASVGHGGASGYLTLMSLASFAPAQMRPLALLMNIGVAGVASVQYFRAGHFRFALLLPLALLAVPMAYWCASMRLPEYIYAGLLGTALLGAAVWMWFAPKAERTTPHVGRALDLRLALGMGAALGALAGLTGIGGGVFLSPLLIFGRYATAKQAGAVAAPFIVLNSISGLIAQRQQLASLPSAAPIWVCAAILGGVIGAHLGASRSSESGLKRLLAVVLMIAGGSLLRTAFAAA
jgi:uncharacterized protein